MSLLRWLLGPKEPVRWDVGMDQMPTVQWAGDRVTITGVRNFQHGCFGQYAPQYETRSYKLSEVVNLDFIVVPFSFARGLAHTMTSFGFSDGRFLTISVEARRRDGESYSLLKGLIGMHPIIYIVADERDAIGLRSVCRGDDVYMFRSTAGAEESRELFVSMMQRVDRLSEEPERYNTVYNNCLTNIRSHVNRIWPRRIPWSWRVLFSGHAAYLAHRLGLLKSSQTFDSAHDAAQISHLAREHIGSDDFSQKIRQRNSPASAAEISEIPRPQ